MGHSSHLLNRSCGGFVNTVQWVKKHSQNETGSDVATAIYTSSCPKFMVVFLHISAYHKTKSCAWEKVLGLPKCLNVVLPIRHRDSLSFVCNGETLHKKFPKVPLGIVHFPSRLGVILKLLQTLWRWGPLEKEPSQCFTVRFFGGVLHVTMNSVLTRFSVLRYERVTLGFAYRFLLASAQVVVGTAFAS